MPWQQDLADVAYEYDPITGLFRYGEVDNTVPRQSGKTTLTLAKKVHRLTVMARLLGPQRSTYTAQTRLKARQKLERDFALLLRGSRSFREVPNAKARPTKPTEWRLSMNNGSESIQFGAGSFLQIDAPSRTGGHGDTLDDGTIDEAFSQEDDTIEAGMRPSMATRRNAQLWVISTAGDERSKYLYRKVLAGREAHRTGQHGRVCYVEYSAHEDADPGDPATWWGCMPALGITIGEDFIAGEWERAQRKGPEGIDTFRRAYLNQWPNVPILKDDDKSSALSLDRWNELVDLAATPYGVVSYGAATAPDRSWSALAAGWRRSDGHLQGVLLDYRPGTDWVEQVADDRRASRGGSAFCDAASDGLIRDGRRLTTVQQAKAQNLLYDAVLSGTFHNGGEAAMATAVRGSRWKPLGDTRVLDRKGTTDISPLIALSNAIHGVTSASTGGWMLGL